MVRLPDKALSSRSRADNVAGGQSVPARSCLYREHRDSRVLARPSCFGRNSPLVLNISRDAAAYRTNSIPCISFNSFAESRVHATILTDFCQKHRNVMSRCATGGSLDAKSGCLLKIPQPNIDSSRRVALWATLVVATVQQHGQEGPQRALLREVYSADPDAWPFIIVEQGQRCSRGKYPQKMLLCHAE